MRGTELGSRIADPLQALAVPIESLTPDPANARKHGTKNLDAIKASLAKFGQRKPIVVQRAGMVVRAGNGTLQAAKALGWTEIAAVVLDDDNATASQFAIADNRSAELAEWDDETLALLLDGMDPGDRVGLGFDEKDLAALMRDLAPPITEDEAPEPPAVAITKPGDLIILGDHRLLCGDSSIAQSADQLLSGSQPDLMVTSPPYNQKIDGFKPSGMHKEHGWVAKVGSLAYADSLPEPEYQQSQRDLLALWFGKMRDGASVFYNHKNRYRDKRVISPLSWLPGPFNLRQEIVWLHPGSVTQNARMFMPCDERIYWMTKGAGFFFDDSTEIKTWSSVWKIATETNKSHAVGYPVALPSRCVRACSRTNDVVVDPFLGSGTTMIACEQLGRRCFGIEIEPRYCDVIVQRWETLTGKKAVRPNG